jgi:CTP-dependent riboflavin kinase
MNKVELKNMPYAAVPFKILEDKDISDSELRLYAIILFFASKEGYCYASNNYLGDMLGIKENSVQRRLWKLERKKYIKRTICKNGQGLTLRKIEINKEFFN